MSWKQANSIASNDNKNAIGYTYSPINETVVPLGASPAADYFYTQYLEAGCYSFSCNYILRNTSTVDESEISRLEFTLTTDDYDDLSEYIYGQTLAANNGQWTFWLNRLFVLPVSSNVEFAVQTHYSMGTLVRYAYNIRLARIT
jgi:hypothetical protein